MSDPQRWFCVPVTLYVEVHIARTDDVDHDRKAASDIAASFTNKYLIGRESDRAKVRDGAEIGYPEHEPGDDEDIE